MCVCDLIAIMHIKIFLRFKELKNKCTWLERRLSDQDHLLLGRNRAGILELTSGRLQMPVTPESTSGRL